MRSNRHIGPGLLRNDAALRRNLANEDVGVSAERQAANRRVRNDVVAGDFTQGSPGLQVRVTPARGVTQGVEIHKHCIALPVDFEGPDTLTLQRTLRTTDRPLQIHDVPAERRRLDARENRVEEIRRFRKIRSAVEQSVLATLHLLPIVEIPHNPAEQSVEIALEARTARLRRKRQEDACCGKGQALLDHREAHLGKFND